MNVKRSVAAAATLVMLLCLASPAYAGGPVTADECRGGGGAVFTNVSGSLECSGGTFDRRLVV